VRSKELCGEGRATVSETVSQRRSKT
jgi:hypothetical protein